MLEEIFRTAKIVSFLDSEVFVERFIGHFFAAGLHEELFKVIVPSQTILKSRHLFEMFSNLDWEGNAHMQTDFFV